MSWKGSLFFCIKSALYPLFIKCNLKNASTAGKSFILGQAHCSSDARDRKLKYPNNPTLFHKFSIFFKQLCLCNTGHTRHAPRPKAHYRHNTGSHMDGFAVGVNHCATRLVCVPNQSQGSTWRFIPLPNFLCLQRYRKRQTPELTRNKKNKKREVCVVTSTCSSCC